MSNKPSMKTHSFRVEEDLLREVQEMCRDHAGKPHYLTISAFLNSAIRNHLEVMRKTINEEIATEKGDEK